MKKRQDPAEVVLVSKSYSADLRGRQSVRTTFRLPPRCIDALSLLAAQLGIKQKSIFDHLIDDLKMLQELARGRTGELTASEDRVAKTYVISRRTLENLDRVARRYQTPRDALVEISIERIMPLLEEEKRKHEDRKQLRAGLDRLRQASRALLVEAGRLLDADDPVREQIDQMARAVEMGCDGVGEVIVKGERLEEF